MYGNKKNKAPKGLFTFSIKLNVNTVEKILNYVLLQTDITFNKFSLRIFYKEYADKCINIYICKKWDVL